MTQPIIQSVIDRAERNIGRCNAAHAVDQMAGCASAQAGRCARRTIRAYVKKMPHVLTAVPTTAGSTSSMPNTTLSGNLRNIISFI